MPVLAAADRVGQALQDGKDLRDGCGLTLDAAQVVALDDPANHVLDQRPGGHCRMPDGVGTVLGDELGRVQAVGHDHHYGLHGELFNELERPLGRASACFVRVERKDGSFGEA